MTLVTTMEPTAHFRSETTKMLRTLPETLDRCWFLSDYDARLINASSPDGFNYAQITQDLQQPTNQIGTKILIVGAPALAFGAVTALIPTVM